MSNLFDFEKHSTKKKYLAAREVIGKYIGFENLVKIESYYANCKLLLELYNKKRLQTACKALELTDTYSDDCDKSFFYNIRFYLANFLSEDYAKIRNEVYQYLGFELTINLETNKNFQDFCVKLHKRQDLFLENMLFFKRFVSTNFFKESEEPYSLEFLELLQYDLGHLILTQNIFEQDFSLKELNTISIFLIENGIIDNKNTEIARFVYTMINNCTKDDISKVYKYKSAWEKSYEYCHNINCIFETLSPVFISATKFILFFRTLNHSEQLGDNIFYSLIILDNINIQRINSYPYCYAKELNNSD